MRKFLDDQKSATILSIALIITGVLLWSANTVGAIVLVTIAMFIMTNTIWRAFLAQIEVETGFSAPSYNAHSVSQRSLGEIERRMRSTLEQMGKSSGLYYEDLDEESFEESTIEDYDAEIPIDLLDGIADEISDRIESIGIMDIDELAIADPDEIAEAARVPIQIAEQWVLDAKALFVGAQISSLIPLSMAEPKELHREIQKSIQSGILKMPVDYELPLSKVKKWIDRANKLVSSVDVSEIQRWLEEGEH